jgi:hypothetical protein
MPSNEEEHQRFLGWPVSSRWPPWESRTTRSHARDGGGKVPGLAHPIAWCRWWLAVRRSGPFAPDFEEFRRQGKGDGRGRPS